jgi:hypothetical protein
MERGRDLTNKKNKKTDRMREERQRLMLMLRYSERVISGQAGRI